MGFWWKCFCTHGEKQILASLFHKKKEVLFLSIQYVKLLSSLANVLSHLEITEKRQRIKQNSPFFLKKKSHS